MEDQKIEIAKWKYFIPFYGIYATYASAESSKGKWWAISIMVTLFTIILIFGSDKKGNMDTGNSNSVTQEIPLSIGSTVSGTYFDITLNGAYLTRSVETGNMFIRLEREDGNQYLVMNVTYKNTDNTGRTLISEGIIYVDFNGKQYEFDKSETLLLDGWGLFLEQMNPLTKKTTNLIFKIPAELKGEIYWNPENGTSKRFLVKKI
ncbi:PF11611 domain protein [Leptospira inadai serovar Lyme str. 10]|uniref:PF11611 domain protein n=2 Tax=Leptospira inadai serovar Lyme TaxID=293084 RepID=V6HE04_9LEPT|nr:DUF4352 domain-containing protein [Leptospira inadai]EQA38217.1 PF11611 domain protein [Leptospira inadai serovar Lyme str. 10]PNV74047.1 DUF4352 domain-containing protein [Leptospira inadai serovar Lyme]